MKTRILITLISWAHLLVALGQSSHHTQAFGLADESAPWHPTKIQQDTRGMIWIGSWNGLYRYDGYTFQAFKAEPGQGIDIPTDRMRNIMMAGGDTLLCMFDERAYRFDVSLCRFDTIPEAEQAACVHRIQASHQMLIPAQTVSLGDRDYENILQDFVDRQGTHWLMGRENIYRVTPIRQPGHLIDNETGNDLIRTLYCDTQGYYWVCTRDERLVSLFSPQGERLGYLGADGNLHPRPLPFDAVYSIHDDGQGTLWLGTKGNGLYRMHRDATKGRPAFGVEHITDIPTNAIYDIQPDGLGCLWMATWGDGIIYLDNPHAPSPIDLHFSQLSAACPAYPATATHVRRLLLRPDGTMLASTTQGLLIVDDVTQSLTQFTMRLHRREASRSTSLMTSAVMAVTFDSKDRMYVATESGGINVLTSPDLHAGQLDFRHITISEGLSSDVTMAFATDASHRVMALSPNGLSVIDLDANRIDNYTTQFWQTTTPFIECSPICTRDRVLVLANEEGVLVTPLDELSQQGFSPYIALTAVTVGTEPTRYDMDGQDTLRLTASQRNVTLRYAAIDQRAVRRLKYRTRLTSDPSAPGTWSRPTDAHELALQDLKPGSYRLDVCSSNADGQWPGNTRTITLIVEPRFFEAWYGQALLWLLFAVVVAAITSTIMYIRHLNAKRQELRQTYLALLESTTTPPAHATAPGGTPEPPASPTGTGDATPPPHGHRPAGIEPAPATPPHLTLAEQQFMQRLMDYVERNLGNSNASLADMADATATSKSSLTRRMHQLLGVTPADFLKEARLKHASQLLRTTTHSLTEISLACGFSDPKYFSKCFKAATGKTPTEYRS